MVVALAGPNGAGKTTFYHAHLEPTGLRLVNADVLARELDLDAYAAAQVADALRRQLVKEGESFVFDEGVISSVWQLIPPLPDFTHPNIDSHFTFPAK